MSEQLPLKQSCTIIWAQRKDRIFLTAEIEDLQIEQLNCQNNQFILKGANSLNRYEIKLELFADLKWDEHKRVESSRHVELVLPKLEDKWWPRLLKSTSKVQWIKSDFDKWIDEEEANEAEAEFKNPFASYLDGGGLPSKPFQFPGAKMDNDADTTSGDDDSETDEEMDDQLPQASSQADQPSTSTTAA